RTPIAAQPSRVLNRPGGAPSRHHENWQSLAGRHLNLRGLDDGATEKAAGIHGPRGWAPGWAWAGPPRRSPYLPPRTIAGALDLRRPRVLRRAAWAAAHRKKCRGRVRRAALG